MNDADDQDSSDTDRQVVEDIRREMQHVNALKEKLLALQKQRLARGTRDVVEQAKEVLAAAARTVDELS